MRGEWLGLVAVTAVLLSCGGGGEPNTPVPQFRVGGTVTGLGGSLTLQLNSGERLTLSQSGPFLFETPIDDENPYRVTIASAPAEEVCTAKDASGRVAGADVDSVQITCVVRTYSLGGTVDGVAAPVELHLDNGEILPFIAPGAFTFQTRLPRGSPYTATVGPPPRGFQCAVNQGSGTVNGNVSTIHVHCTPWFIFSSFQPASLVIGQSDFSGYVSNHGDAVTAHSLLRPSGNPAFVANTLYVPDTANNRVLGFTGMPTQSDPDANFFLGQIDAFTHSQSAGPRGLAGTMTLAVENSQMVVADRDNNRVVVYHSPPAQTYPRADLVVGQADFLNISPRCDAHSVAFPGGVALSDGKLVVADTGNNRILIWNELPKVMGMDADIVLGQTNFTSCNRNYSTGDPTMDPPPADPPSASTLARPGGVWTDGIRLIVADIENNRVLIWNTFPTVSSQPADRVLGQPDFTTRTAALTATGMNRPNNVQSTGQQLFVTDGDNSRVLIWNQLPTMNGAPAEIVLGQQDFTSINLGELIPCPEHPAPDDPPCTPGYRPNARSLNSPSGILLAAPRLLVTDTGSHRVLIYESQ